MKLLFSSFCGLGLHWQRRSRLDLSSGHVQRYCRHCGAEFGAGRTAIAKRGHRLAAPAKRFSLASALMGLAVLVVLFVAPHVDFKGQPAEAASSARLPEARPQLVGHPGWTDQVAAAMLNTEQPEETN